LERRLGGDDARLFFAFGYAFMAAMSG